MPAWSHMCLHICVAAVGCGGAAIELATLLNCVTRLEHALALAVLCIPCLLQLLPDATLPVVERAVLAALRSPVTGRIFQCQYACGTMLMLPNACRSCRRTRRCQRWSGRCWRRCATRRDAITRSAPRSSCSPTSRTPGAAPHHLLLPFLVFSWTGAAPVSQQTALAYGQHEPSSSLASST